MSLLATALAPYREGLSALDRRAASLIAASFLFVGARMSVLTFLAIYLEKERGIGIGVIGLAILLENVARGVVSLFGGAWSDRVGRKPVIVLSSLAAGLMIPLFLFVRDPVHLILWSVALGAAQGPYFPAIAAYLVDLVEPHRRQSALAVNYTAVSLGYTIGVAPAGFLAAAGYGTLAAASAAAFALGAVLVLVLAPRSSPSPVARTGVLRQLARPLRDRGFLWLCAPAFLFPLGLGLISISTPLYAADMGLSEQAIGLLLAATGPVLIVLSIPVNARLESGGPLRLLAPAALLCAAGYVVLAARGSPSFLFGGLVVFTLGEVLFSAAAPTAVAALAPADARGAYQGAWGLLFSIGIGAALLFAGQSRDLIGWQATWMAFAAATALAAAGLAVVTRRLAASERLKRTASDPRVDGRAEDAGG